MTNGFSHCRFGLGTLVSILAVIAIAGCSRRVISIEQVDKMIRDQVPIGSSKETVKDFIDKLQLDSLKILRDTEFHQADRFSLGNFDQEKTNELGDRIAEFTGAAIVNSKSDGVFTFDNIGIRFYIDKDGRMIDYSIKEWGSD